eukprot:GFKZ01006106.1.p1 GENE.GFKZ01006106.1~~GFKZ01006106.1.p1  ORF type:complete len:194 (+),score=0.12 GFKZ01006106.1:100-681(+)
MNILCATMSCSAIIFPSHFVLLLLLSAPALSTTSGSYSRFPPLTRQVRLRCPCACTANVAVARSTCARTPISNCRVSRCNPSSNGFSCCAAGQSPPRFRFPSPNRPELQRPNSRNIAENGRAASEEEPERSQELADLLLETINRIGELAGDSGEGRPVSARNVLRQSTDGAFAQFASASQQTLLYVYSNLVLH